MCFPHPNVPNTADEAAAAEATRAAKVAQTSGLVNQTFDSKYGPNYYSGIGDAYKGFYKPQVEDQYKDASRATALRFADNADSSAAHRSEANLYKDRLAADTQVDTGAVDAQNKAKQDVENKRAALIGMAESGASPENTAALARGQASANLGQPSFSPVGDLFAKYTNTLSRAAQASDSGYRVNPFFQQQVDFLRGGSSGGSQRLVG